MANVGVNGGCGRIRGKGFLGWWLVGREWVGEEERKRNEKTESHEEKKRKGLPVEKLL